MDQKIFERDHYLNQLLVASAHSDILVVTGLRKAGKSTLAKDLFLPRFRKEKFIDGSHLISENVSAWKKEERTLERLEEILDSGIKDDSRHLVFLDEIQLISGDYPSYLRSLALRKNVLLLLTGSNSHGLSSDIAEAFGDDAFPIPVYPLTYAEILEVSPDYPFDLYFRYGGLPDIVNMLQSGAGEDSRSNYLDDVLDKIYFKDIYGHDPSLSCLGEDKVRGVLAHFACFLTTEISVRKSIQTFCEDFQKSRKRLLGYEERSLVREAFANLISDYEKSYLAYLFEEDGYDLIEKKDADYKEARKLYIADQGLLYRLSAGSSKLNENLLENLVYLELRRAGFRPRGLEVSFLKEGLLKRGQVDFAFQNSSLENVYIQVVYNFGNLNFDREVSSLLALGEGRKILIYREESLLGLIVPEGIEAVSIHDFCLRVASYCN